MNTELQITSCLILTWRGFKPRQKFWETHPWVNSEVNSWTWFKLVIAKKANFSMFTNVNLQKIHSQHYEQTKSIFFYSIFNYHLYLFILYTTNKYEIPHWTLSESPSHHDFFGSNEQIAMTFHTHTGSSHLYQYSIDVYSENAFIRSLNSIRLRQNRRSMK